MNKKSRTTYTYLNIFSNFVGYGLNLIISFVCRMVFTRCLSEAYLGVNGLFSNILSMLALSELGVGTAFEYALYKPIADDDQEKIASLMSYYGKAYRAIGCVVAVLGLLLLPFLKPIIGQTPDISENIYLIYLLYLFSSASSYFFSYRMTLLTASQRGYVNTTINYIVVIVQNVLQIFALILFHNFLIYLGIQVTCGFLSNVICSEKAKKDYPYMTEKHPQKLPEKERKGIISNVRSLTIYKLSGLLVNNTDNIVITFFNGLNITGIASNYTLLSGMISTLLNLVFGSVSASVGNVNAKETEQKKFTVFKALNLANYWLYAWGTIGIIVVSNDVVKLLFGSKYVLPQNISVIIGINFFLVGMQSAVLNYKSTMGLFRYGRYILLFTAAINIAGDIILGKYLGLFGIFLATAISRIVTNIWYEPYAVYKYGFHKKPLEYAPVYIRYTAMTCISLLISYEIGNLFNLPLAAEAVYKIAVCSVVHNVVSALIMKRTEEYSFLKDKVLYIFRNHNRGGKQ